MSFANKINTVFRSYSKTNNLTIIYFYQVQTINLESESHLRFTKKILRSKTLDSKAA